MKKSRLLVLASTYPRWLADHEPGFVHELSRRLTASFEVHVLCPHAPGALTEENLEGVQVHRFRYAPARLETLVQGGGIVSNLKHHRWKWLLVPLFFLGMAWRAWLLVRRLRPDYLHAHWLIPQGLVVATLQAIDASFPPFLVTAHGADLFALGSRPFLALKRFVVRRAGGISVVSSYMTGEVSRLGADPNRIQIIPMGVDFGNLFTPGEVPSRRAGEILFVGRLVEKKGVRYLIEALPFILVQAPQVSLRIAGFGPEESSLRALVKKLGVEERVDFLGAVPHASLPELYQRAAVFVAPFIRTESGDQEGLPVVLMEAIACGCPLLVGDLPVLSDIFLAEEEEFLIRPRDVEELSGKILKLLAEIPSAMARTALVRERLIGRVSWDAVAESYATCLRAVVDKL